MGSETDEVASLLEDTYDSLDINEINDVEYDIPPVTTPSLESVLWDMESEEGSDNASLHSVQSMTLKLRSMLYHCVLQGLTAQITSAEQKVGAGLPTVITNSSKYVSIGTSHGYVLTFDSEQKLCWYYHDSSVSDQGGVSAVALNLDSTRLLVGYERGYIVMLDAIRGDVLRKLPDAHAPQSAVLHLRFTYISNLALCGDSSGCVFSLTFNRRLGVRNWDSRCLFSGARGEVCVFEPLLQGNDVQFLNQNVLVAMATLSKVIVISVRPRLRVLFTHLLPRAPTSLPLLSWQLVSVGRNFQPVLAWGRGNELNYTRVISQGTSINKIRLSTLRSVQLPYTLTALHWLGTRHLAVLDTSENLRLVEVRTQRELEVLELASAGLVYSSAQFKALAVGGGVSEAFALVGERACYNSLSSRGDQLLVLGTKAVHMVKLRTWPERLLYLSEQGRWTEALNIAAEEGLHRDKVTVLLLEQYLSHLNQRTVDRDSLTAAVNCCVKLKKIDLLCDEFFETVSGDQNYQDWYYTLLTDHICNGFLHTLRPAVAQSLIDYLQQNYSPFLETVLLSLSIESLDLHQALRICRNQNLYDAWIHITTKAIGDYTAPFTELLSELTPDNHKLGNTMLVYVSACLTGLGYPTGKIPTADIPRVKYDILRCLEAVHSMNPVENEQSYPYLRALLKYNTRECLNVIELAFKEAEFAGEMGLLQRQRLVHILMQIVTPPEFTEDQVIILACFITRLVTSNNLNLEDQMLETVAKSLTNVVGKSLNLRDHMEREQALLDLLTMKKLKVPASNGLLQTALDSNCYRVAEYLYNKEKNYANILFCYLNDPFRRNEVFNYILTYITVRERHIKEQFLVNFKELLKIDSKKTAEIVAEHFADLINELCALIDADSHLQYMFLKELITSDVKLPTDIALRYLELLCIKNKPEVNNYVQMNLCPVDAALTLTRKYEIHSATAFLLEQIGQWMEAMDLLLEYNMVQDAMNVCIRGAEHLDVSGAQQLWLKLLQNKVATENMSLRQLLHAAAPHVPPAQLLELVSNASLGDAKVLLNDMLADCTYDIQMLEISLRVLSKDLHHGLAKALCTAGKAVPVNSTLCYQCQKSVIANNFLKEETAAVVFECGHIYHSSCLSVDGTAVCPHCRVRASPMASTSQTTPSRSSVASYEHTRTRPDVEGHF